MEGAIRLRVEFDDHRHLLTKSQRSEGFDRCWIFLRPDLSTVSDLAAHLISAFALRLSCPHGVVLSIDDFVLPSFESTSIFRDNDVIRLLGHMGLNRWGGIGSKSKTNSRFFLWLRKKAGKKKGLLAICGNGYHLQDSDFVEKQPIMLGDELPTIEDSQEFLEACKSQDEENACGTVGNITAKQMLLTEEKPLKRKRKQSDKPHNSKKKKIESDILKNSVANHEENVHPKQHKIPSSCQPCSVSDTAEDISNVIVSQHEVQRKHSAIVGEREKGGQVHKDVSNVEDSQEISSKPDGETKKTPSRSARRKKAKRRWHQEMTKQQVEAEQRANATPAKSFNVQATEQISNGDEDIVPVIVRPGHIRFEPIDEHSEKQSSGPVETLQWNGITSKKKGQKWGQEKAVSRTSEDSTHNGASHGNLITVGGNHVDDHTDFESLFPLTRLPEGGDVIVYRLVELSSSWCPELSPFRVGKVSSYDSISQKIVLVPVPEYPISCNEQEAVEESSQQPDHSLYKEDGSLEIEYSSLLDVRLLESHGSDNLQSKDAAILKDSGNALIETNSKLSAAPRSETRPSTCWEQIEQALIEKKAQLQKSDKDKWVAWTSKTSTSPTPWSYRVLRRNAVGPTMALLRGNNHNTDSSDKHVPAKSPCFK